MTTTATGGFATHNDSTAFFNSPTIEYISIVFQFLAGINFMMLYASIFKLKPLALFKSSEFKLYITIISISTLWILYLLMTRNGYGLERAFRSALFQVVSFITTTGLFNDDAARWPHITWVILGCLMFVGAFTIMVILTATLMIAAGIDNTNAVTISLSCISNVGPTLGTQIGPEMSWSELPTYVKWLCSFLMLVGRLEIMSVLVLFTRGFWKDN